MSPRKINKAFALAGITMPSIIEHITRNLQGEWANLETMTAKQLSAVIAIHHKAFFDGRASTNAVVEDGCVWVGNTLMIPLAALAEMDVTSKFEIVRTAQYNGARGGTPGMIVDADGKNVPDAVALKLWDTDREAAKKLWWTRRDHVTTYRLDFVERV